MPARHLAAALALVLALTACPRGVRPGLGEDRTVTTGVSVRVGSEDPEAPELTFDFGDGSPKVTGRMAAHPYARAGSYTLRALRGEGVLAMVKLTVVPRPLLAAVPPEASSVVFLPLVAGHLEASIDFLEKLLGADAVQNFLDESVLPALAMEMPSSESPVIDPQEGLGLFTLPQFEGAIALLGVIDGDKAQEALVKQLERRGGYARQEADQTVRVRLPGGRELAVFVDRGYLYVALPEGSRPEPLDPDDPSLRGLPPLLNLEPALTAVRKAADEGLSGQAAIAGARARLPPGNVYLFLASPPAPTQKLGGLFASLVIGDRAVELDGIIQADGPMYSALAVPRSRLLEAAPQGAIAAVSATVPPAELAGMLIGGPETPRRKAAAERARHSGVDLEALLKALGGDLTALVYFDSDAFLTNLAQGSEKPEPRGALLVEVGLTRTAPIEEMLQEQLSSMGLRYDRVEEKGLTRYLSRWRGQPVELQLTPGRALLSAGGDTRGRKQENLAAALGARFGGAFGPGHLSAMVDLGQLRKELAEPRTIPGIDPRRLVMVQGFASAFLSQLTPIDHAFLDLSPDAAGGRLKGRLTLKEK
ncbi:MAG: PKD domain-containing protein [Myxococcaceae bacterium]